MVGKPCEDPASALAGARVDTRGLVHGGLHLVVRAARLLERVADSREADAAGDGERADHVQHDARLALRVPPEPALLDDVPSPFQSRGEGLV
jgi:hypothetical protein